MKKIFKVSTFLILVWILISCTSAPLTGRSQLKLVGDQELAESLSAQYKKLIEEARSKKLLVNNTSDGNRLVNVASRVSKAAERFMYNNNMGNSVKYLNWEFNLIKSDIVNAFALPGGKIVFYTGILPVLQNDAGIAYVIGHEIGHVIGGHHAELYSQQLAASGISSITTGIFGGDSVSSLVNNGLSITLLKFNRDHEYEADKYGLILMAMAGYNPEEGIKAEERMGKVTNNNGADFLSTHPRSQKRIEELRKFLPEAMKYYKK
ncbi:MAG: M48 family metallopeptidase [Leptotrichiaceae bacterium]|nr:M48 family metallopeptidase [Leptotrichiaceae bacterium]MBP6280924.1 M48 family metallopeptidase [Leptotrichiaceae bacterium]MBP7100593.1 M48 family metallopeptidase [Leptotrichiaceae bacterium]MBP7739357.1 M48 family metallopeptidase [Leptotrichiaceae bacterium]MBP9629345.1 M48 family metallopeptidase [Leptotrichiaceae bacterium]